MGTGSDSLAFPLQSSVLSCRYKIGVSWMNHQSAAGPLLTLLSIKKKKKIDLKLKAAQQ